MYIPAILIFDLNFLHLYKQRDTRGDEVLYY